LRFSGSNLLGRSYEIKSSETDVSQRRRQKDAEKSRGRRLNTVTGGWTSQMFLGS
jgi:hypothetical protein